jgi:hypothetical protein
MIDRLFAAALTFCVLAAGTVAIASEFVAKPEPKIVRLAPVEVNVVRLPAVQVTAQRGAASTALARTEGTEPATRGVQ